MTQSEQLAELNRIQSYLNQARDDVQRGKTLAKSDFQQFVESIAGAVARKVEELWDWLKSLFG